MNKFQTYELASSSDDDADINDVVLDWEANFQDLMEDKAESYSSIFTVLYLTGRSIDDALAESVSGEIYLFIATCEKRPLGSRFACFIALCWHARPRGRRRSACVGLQLELQKRENSY